MIKNYQELIKKIESGWRGSQFLDSFETDTEEIELLFLLTEENNSMKFIDFAFDVAHSIYGDSEELGKFHFNIQR